MTLAAGAFGCENRFPDAEIPAAVFPAGFPTRASAPGQPIFVPHSPQNRELG